MLSLHASDASICLGISYKQLEVFVKWKIEKRMRKIEQVWGWSQQHKQIYIKVDG